MTKALIWLGHIVAIGLIITGIAAGYSFAIPLGIVSEVALWTCGLFFFRKSGRLSMRHSRPKHTTAGMINLQGFKRENRED